MEKRKFYHHKNLLLFKYVDVDIHVSSMISSGVKNFICYKDEDYKSSQKRALV